MIGEWRDGARPPRIGVLDLMTKPVNGQARSHWTRLLDIAPGRMPPEHVINLDPHAGPAPGTLPSAVRVWLRSLGALVVTGAEPRSADLDQDPVHNLVGRILDVTSARSTPVLFSCLSAHSALRHLHSLPRRRLPEKRVGVLPHTVTDAAGPCVARFTGPLLMPHSRWNTVLRQDLVRAGVRPVLALGPDDWAVAHDAEGYVFVQGHPEYSAGTLLREYVRDVGRFVRGTLEFHPTLPVGYLTPAQEEQLRGYALLARSSSSLCGPELTVDPLLAQAWREAGRALVADWTSGLVGTACA
jgi:homoserine O-succinyltransferase